MKINSKELVSNLDNLSNVKNKKNIYNIENRNKTIKNRKSKDKRLQPRYWHRRRENSQFYAMKHILMCHISLQRYFFPSTRIC